MLRKIFLSLVLLPALNAGAAELTAPVVDYGVPGNPFTDAILPGQSGDLFVTLKNTSALNLQRVSLNSYAGECVDEITSPLQIEQIAPNAELRIASPLRIRISASCARGQAGSFLLIGTYADSMGNPQRIWSEVKFFVAAYPEVNFLADNLQIPLPDLATVNYDFDVTTPINIQDIGITVRLTHTYHGDLTITLRHPSGATATIFSNSSGNGLLNLNLGYGGSPTSALSVFNGLNAAGKWTLTIRDSAGDDDGTLIAVGLRARAGLTP